MAGYYRKRPDGLLDVTTADGLNFPVNLSEDEAKQAGLTPANMPSQLNLAPMELPRAEMAKEQQVLTAGAPSGLTPGVESEERRNKQLLQEQSKALSTLGPAPQAPQRVAEGGQVEQWRAMQAAGQRPVNAPPSGSSAVPSLAAVPAPGQAGVAQQPAYARIPGSAGRTIPAGWVPGQRQFDTTQYSEEALDKLREGMREQGVDASVQRRIMADAMAKVGQEKRQEAAVEFDRAKQYQAQIDLSMAALEADRAEIAGQKVDPSKVWADRGAFAGILSAIAQGVGQYAAVKGGGQNMAAQIIDRMVERDIEAQRANIALRQQGFQTKLTLLDRYMQNHDPQTAEKMARLALNDAVKAEIESQQQTAQSRAMLSEVDKNIAAIELDLSKIRVAQTEQYQQARAVGGSAPVTLDLKLLQEIGAMGPNGQLLVTPAQAQKLQQQYYASKAGEMAKGGTGKQQKISVEATKVIAQAEHAETLAGELAKAIREDGRSAVAAMQEGKGKTAVQLAHMKTAVLRLESGAAITAGDKEDIMQTLGGLSTGMIDPETAAYALDLWGKKMARFKQLASTAGAPERPAEVGEAY